MAEVQRTTLAGEHVAQFIEFVLMHAQQAALFLGQIPNPHTGKPEVNLDLARMFIDQLEMIQEKTRGNLNEDETKVLGNALTNLRMAFVQATSKPAETAAAETPPPEPPQPPPPAEPIAPEPSAAESSESKKRFTKKYD